MLSERDSIYFRPQPFFQNTSAVEAEQQTLLAFWRDPANPANADLLRAAKIGYVIVPQIITDPGSIETMVRWRLPLNDVAPMQSKISDAPYLTKVFDQDGAQVWEVKG